MHFNGLKFSGAVEEFSITLQFLKKIRVLCAVFFNLSTGDFNPRLADLKEHQTHFAYEQFYMIFLKKLIFCILQYFLK